MKLSSFLIGMLAAATAVAIATLSFGGSLAAAVAMWFATLLVAQILYIALLVGMARFSGEAKHAGWQDSGVQPAFSRTNDLGEGAGGRSSGPNA